MLIWNLVLVAILGVGIFTLFHFARDVGEESVKSFGEVLRDANPVWAAILVGVVIVIMTLDFLKYAVISKAVVGKYNLVIAMKVNILGKYYDAVTPFSTGGQPMQIIYMTGKGISGGNASAIAIIRYCGHILLWISTAAVFMTVGIAMGALDDVGSRTFLMITGWIGLGINLIIPMFVLLFVLFPKFAKKLADLFITAGMKLRIIKDREVMQGKVMKVVGDFTSSFATMAKNPVQMISLIAVCLVEIFLTFAVPYFVMRALSCNVEGILFKIMVLNCFAIFGVSFIPTPGNSGVMENMGLLAFSVTAGATLAWSVLFWRFSVYYIYVLIGIGVTVFDLIRKNIKVKKADR